MDFTSFSLMMDIFPLIILFVYGYKFKYKPPKYGSDQGLRTAYSTMHEEAWKYGHSFAGNLCLLFGTLETLAVVTKYSIYGFNSPMALDLAVVGVALLFVFLLMPLMNLQIKSVYGSPKDTKKKKK